MTERKGQGLYNRLWNRRESFLDGEDTIEKINNTVAQKLYNISDTEFDIIMDNVMKDNRVRTTNVTYRQQGENLHG